MLLGRIDSKTMEVNSVVAVSSTLILDTYHLKLNTPGQISRFYSYLRNETNVFNKLKSELNDELESL